jgi:hypothetical protein
MARNYFLIFLFGLLFMLAGCSTTPKALIVTQNNAAADLPNTSPISLIPHPNPRAEERELLEILTQELHQQGWRIVREADSDYELAFWIEDGWKYYNAPPPVNALGPIGTPHALRPPTVSDENVAWQNRAIQETASERSVPIQGIRLKLFSRADRRAGKLTSHWDGYIETGEQLTPEQKPLLVKLLVTHFGKTYTGRVKLVQ